MLIGLIIAAVVVIAIIILIVVLNTQNTGTNTSGYAGAANGTTAPPAPAPAPAPTASGPAPTGTGAANIEKEEIGALELTKIKIATTFDVCSDEVENFDDYKNFYILEKGGDYYHWLKEPEGKDDEKLKLLDGIIPITLHSDQTFKFEATFKVLQGKINKMSVKVKDNSGKYQFDEQTKSSLSKNDEFTLTFQSTTKPYKDTIQYLENFYLNFDVINEDDGMPLFNVKAKFKLYITWKEPEWDEYDKIKDITDGKIYQTQRDGDQKKSLRVTNNSRKYILEPLLFISCQNKISPISENQVVDQIFDNIKSLKVKRPRHSEELGYWRCSSALDPTQFPRKGEDFGKDRSVRFMLRVGDGRCGEWTEFFSDLCLTQGVKNTDMLPFNVVNPYFEKDTNFISNIFLVKSWDIRDPHRPIDKGGKAQGNDKPMNFFNDHVFSVYKGIFYDASYGLKGKITHSTWINILKEYCPIALQGIPFSKKDINGEAFFDNLHSKKYIDPQTFKIYNLEAGTPKFTYKTIDTNYEKYFIL